MSPAKLPLASQDFRLVLRCGLGSATFGQQDYKQAIDALRAELAFD